MIDPAEELRRLTTLQPIETLREEDECVLLWWFPNGSLEIGDFDSVAYHRNVLCDSPTHWSPIPKVEVSKS